MCESGEPSWSGWFVAFVLVIAPAICCGLMLVCHAFEKWLERDGIEGFWNFGDF